MNSDICNKLLYWTDVEGSWTRFVTLVEKAASLELLRYEKKGETMDVALAPQVALVYGGDVGDKGPGTIRIVRILLALKKRYPKRVFLILGNRDLNKIRITSEMADLELSRAAADVVRPPWLPNPPSYVDFLSGRPDCAKNRLLYILDVSMSAPEAFENTRTELGLLGEPNDDAAIVEHFVKFVGPEGLFRQYLMAGQLALIWHDILFVHCGITNENLGYGTPTPPPLYSLLLQLAPALTPCSACLPVRP